MTVLNRSLLAKSFGLVLPLAETKQEARPQPTPNKNDASLYFIRHSVSAQHAQATFMPISMRSGTSLHWSINNALSRSASREELVGIIPKLTRSCAEVLTDSYLSQIDKSKLKTGIHGTIIRADIERFETMLKMTAKTLPPTEYIPFFKFLAQHLDRHLSESQPQEAESVKTTLKALLALENKPTTEIKTLTDLMTHLYLPTLSDAVSPSVLLEALNKRTNKEEEQALKNFNMLKAITGLMTDYLEQRYTPPAGKKQDSKLAVLSTKLQTALDTLPTNRYSTSIRDEINDHIQVVANLKAKLA
jgi:hypothetical protein